MSDTEDNSKVNRMSESGASQKRKRTRTGENWLRDALVPRKRGRRPKEADGPIILDAAAVAEQEGATSKRRNSAGSEEFDVDAEEKRKLQNRAAQRAFRERREKHVKEMQEQLKLKEDECEQLKQRIKQLEDENTRLKAGPATVVKPEAVESAASTLTSTVTLAPSPVPVSIPAPIASPATAPAMQQSTPAASLEFDFDAPFDAVSSVPIPPLFQDFFEQSFATPSLPEPSASTSSTTPSRPATSKATAASTTIATADEDADADLCPIDDASGDPVALDQVPCPECDFTALSCALPIPWRPAGLDASVPPQNVWVAKKAWAKLCSHPLFDQCDVEELCAELKARTRCSDDGRIVVTKEEVCDVFRTIPARAKLARQRRELDQVGPHEHVS